MKYLYIVSLFLLFNNKVTAQVTTFRIDSSKFNKPLMITLDSLYQEDQSSRYSYLTAKQDKSNPAKADSLLKVMQGKDKLNLLKVTNILDKYGWQGPEKVGINASQGLFIVIQHADLATQKKYINMFRQAEKNGEILSSNLAIMEDRINIREGREQLYGSQRFINEKTGKTYTYPIVDVEQLDLRRKTMGMPPMKDYVKEWDIQEYKKTLPELEQVIKERAAH